MTVWHPRVVRTLGPLASAAFIALALLPVSAQKPDSAPAYRFIVLSTQSHPPAREHRCSVS
jgi:hypothetical protein